MRRQQLILGVHTSSDVDGQFTLHGWEYQVEIRDNSDGTGNVNGSQSVFVSGQPVVAIDTDTDGIYERLHSSISDITLTRSATQIANDADQGSNYTGNTHRLFEAQGSFVFSGHLR